MKRLALLFCLLPILLSAQTLITGGNVSGVWDSTGSPYLVDGDICVPSGSTFVIEAGCTLKFLGYYELRVDSGATFKIKGTADAPVVVTANDSFRGIKLNYVSACTLEYMKLSRGMRGMTIENSEVVIKNSEIDSCKYCLGGGIWAENSNIEIDSCNFYDNIAQTGHEELWECDGEGISDPYIACGGAGYFINSEVVVTNSEFIRNRSESNMYDICYIARDLASLGGAIRVKYSSITINNCIFQDNQAIGAHGMDCYYHYYPPGPGGDAKGGAICAEGNLSITNTVFINNKAIPGEGGYADYTCAWDEPGSSGEAFGQDVCVEGWNLQILNSTLSDSGLYFAGTTFISINSYIKGADISGTVALIYNSYTYSSNVDCDSIIINDCIDYAPITLCDDGALPYRSILIDAGAESVVVGDSVIYAPLTDLTGNPRPMGDGIDIGAYEFNPDNPSICSSIHRGWNLLSFPTADTVNAFDHIPYYIPQLFVWNAELQRYEVQDSIVGPTQPFFAFLPKDTSGHYSLPSVLDSVTYILYPGWNLIGAPATVAAASVITGLPEVEAPVYGLHITRSGSVEYQPVDLLIPGYGYWVFATDTVEITLP